MKRLFILFITVFLLAFSSESIQQVEAEILPSDDSSLDLYDESTFMNVVIFIRFQDETTYNAPYDLAYYDNLFNGVDTPSLRDYYLEVSYDQLTINSFIVTDNDAFIYYEDIYDRDYYEPFDAIDNPNGYSEVNRDNREHELLKRAIDFVDENNLVPDSLNLDVNNDGDIDSITFLVSGEANEWNDLFWPHKWELTNYYNYAQQTYKEDAPTINGLHAFLYTFELLGYTTEFDYQVSVPIIAHETFHLISAPDLYHYYRYDWIDPIGNWGLMDSIGDIPTHMLGYMKYQYGGWIESVNEITTSGTYRLHPLQDSPNNLYRIDTGYDNEYVYLEYRDQQGMYESATPDSGLIAYRVDVDYQDRGNVQGYYLNDNETVSEEVFVFRPGIEDLIPRITFSPEDLDFIDEDGSIDDAALSQYNLYDEMGIGTDFIMFHSDGTLMNISIRNVIESDGYITFDVVINNPQVSVVSEYTLGDIEDIHFVDAPETYYSITIDNIDTAVDVYYTLDGSYPTTEDFLYTGGEIEITATLNHLQAIVVEEHGTTIHSFEQEFDFVTNFETNHDNYGYNVHEYWLLQFNYLTNYSISFNDQFELSTQEDYINIHNETGVTQYSLETLKDTSLEYINNGLLFEFVTDSVKNNTYGFTGNLEIVTIFENIGYILNGEDVIYVEVFGTFFDEGLQLLGYGSDTAYVETETDMDLGNTGEYNLVYNVYNNQDELVGTISRTVIVVDTVSPVIELLGEEDLVLEVFSDFTDSGISFTDNYLASSPVTITGEVDMTTLGVYELFYTLYDDSGNESNTVSRTVHVVDTTSPTVFINAGIDTIIQNGVWVDRGINVQDNYTDSLTIDMISNTVDVRTPGVYSVMYRVSDSSENFTQVTRYVTVLSTNQEVDVECGIGITTYQQNDEFIPLTCMFNDVEGLIDVSRLDMNVIGTQEVYYQATIDGVVYEHKTYIFVIKRYMNTLDFDFERKRGEFV